MTGGLEADSASSGLARYGLEPCNGQRLTPFANALDLSIDDLIFGPYFGIPRQPGTPAHRAVNSTAALSARSIKGGPVV